MKNPYIDLDMGKLLDHLSYIQEAFQQKILEGKSFQPKENEIRLFQSGKVGIAINQYITRLKQNHCINLSQTTAYSIFAKYSHE